MRDKLLKTRLKKVENRFKTIKPFRSRNATCFCLLFAITLLNTNCRSYIQKRKLTRFEKQQLDTMNIPYWIDMMKDTGVNYYSAISAFDLFWKDKPRPLQDKTNEGQNLFESKDSFVQQNLQYVSEYKQFLGWKRAYEYRVKPNGKIISDEEMYQEWYKQKQQKDSIKK